LLRYFKIAVAEGVFRMSEKVVIEVGDIGESWWHDPEKVDVT
jgi:hypothetical protein